MRDILIALAIALPAFLAAVFFHFYLRQLARRVAAKTGTALDNMLIRALEGPLLVLVVMVGLYFAVLYLPLSASLDFEIRRGFHVAFIAVGAYGVAALLDALFRWFNLEIATRTHTTLDAGIVVLMRLFAPLLAGLLALLASLGLFQIEVPAVRDWLVAHGLRIGLILLLSFGGLLILGTAGCRAIAAFVAREAAGQSEEEVRKRAQTLTTVLVTTGQVFIIVIAGFVVLSELGINIAPIMAGAGVVGIALGFGAQSLVKDLIAGLFIVLENQYRVGDVVRIADTAGLVEEINLRRTVLRDLDGIVHVVPNGEIRVASDFTKGWSRVNLNISVSYGTDLDRAIAVINQVCQEIAADPQWAPHIIKTPEVLRVDKLGDSGIELKVLGDTKPIQQWAVMGEIRKRVKKAFDVEGIEIPWPHTKVYFGSSPFPGTTQESRKGP